MYEWCNLGAGGGVQTPKKWCKMNFEHSLSIACGVKYRFGRWMEQFLLSLQLTKCKNSI